MLYQVGALAAIVRAKAAGWYVKPHGMLSTTGGKERRWSMRLPGGARFRSLR